MGSGYAAEVADADGEYYVEWSLTRAGVQVSVYEDLGGPNIGPLIRTDLVPAARLFDTVMGKD